MMAEFVAESAEEGSKRGKLSSTPQSSREFFAASQDKNENENRFCA